jgi:hypothetical protein
MAPGGFYAVGVDEPPTETPEDDEERVSLSGLNPIDALRGLLQVNPNEMGDDGPGVNIKGDDKQ